ncbi:hypothetical protein ACOSP7_012753 [Xanthoceras sorbifolium]
MNTAEVEELCAALSLADADEPTAILDEGLQQVGRRKAIPIDEGNNAVHGSPSCHAAGGTVVGVVNNVGSLETAQHVACKPKLRTIEGQCVGGGVNSAGSGILTRADIGPIQSRLGSRQQVHMATVVGQVESL